MKPEEDCGLIPLPPEAKAANRRKDLDDSLRGSPNIAAGIAEQEEQEDFKNQW